MLDQEMIKELIEGLCSIFGETIYKIILYGSVAQNTATKESDIDVAILLDREIPVAYRRAFLEFAADLDLKYERVFSIIDIERTNMEKWGDVLPFYKNIQKEGIVLWEAA